MKSDLMYLVVDTETTGLSPNKHAICEIACCPMDNELNDLPEYVSGIIKPYADKEIDDRALEHNGITRQQLENGRDSKEVVNEFIKYLRSFKKSKTKVILVGHNIVKFDIPHLVDLFEAHDKDIFTFVLDGFYLDTLWWSRMKYLESANYKLGTCCQNEKIELVDAHRALSDTRSNKELARIYLKNLRGEGQGAVKEEKKIREKFQL